MTTIELKDLRTIPDPIYKYEFYGTKLPLVIDNGSYQCRVGWANDSEPRLLFKNIIAKPRKERGKKDGDTQVGNDITNIEAVRFQLKTQFDRNVVTHFEVQEQIFDYMFTHLGIDTEGCVDHPIVLTEAFLNPNYSRQLMSELLFECYRVPSVSYGVDALFSVYENFPNVSTALIVSCGYHTVHILPILNGQVDPSHSRRINTGGSHIINYLHRLLQLKYPSHFAAINLSRAEELVHEHSFIAEDFQEELKQWGDSEYYDGNVMKIQLPYSAPVIPLGLSAEQQKERRRELARRLTEVNARKREERLAEDEEQLSQLTAVQDLLEEGDEKQFQEALESYDIANGNELQKLISQLQTRIEKTRQKIVAANTSEENSEEQKQKISKTSIKPNDPEDAEAWLSGLRQKRLELVERRNARRQRRQDMAKRRTAAAQERMRLISQLARKEKRDDTFGMRDEDWDVYKVINKEGGDSDSDEEQKLLELEDILRQHDPEFEGSVCSNSNAANTAETHQLHVGIERLRVPEILFQPSLIGSGEAGIAETIEFLLKGYPLDTQNLLVQNVIVTGGCAKIPGFAERLKKELLEMRPFKSTFNIHLVKDPVLDAWKGATKFAAHPSFEKFVISRKEYDEHGGDFLKAHYASNVFYPLPIPLAQQDVEIDFMN